MLADIGDGIKFLFSGVVALDLVTVKHVYILLGRWLRRETETGVQNIEEVFQWWDH